MEGNSEVQSPSNSCSSDLSDLFPRKLRYSEEILPLQFCETSEAAPIANAAPRGLRPVKVFARIKPGGDDVPEGGSEPLLATSSEVSQRGRDGNSTVYTFDHVFEGSEQDKFFAIAVEPLVEELVSMSTSSSVFMAYGASGTGKTYTMRGTAAEPGVIPLTLDCLYRMLGERSLEHQVLLSCYEVHDNKVYDLLQAARSGKPPTNHLPITQLGPGCCLPGLLRCHSESAEAGRRLYAAASRIRKQAATAVNTESSRSHAIFTVQVLDMQQGAAKGRSASLSLVDLAGAEREEQTKLAGNKLRESGGINKSLMVLGRCLAALRYNQALAQRPPGQAGAAALPPRVIPVRESSITNLFRGVLTGQGNLAISVHVSKRSRDSKLTQSTLEFAAVASRLQVSVAPAAPPPPPLPPQGQQQQQAVKHQQQLGVGARPGGLEQEARRVFLAANNVEPCIPECQEEGEQQGVEVKLEQYETDHKEDHVHGDSSAEGAWTTVPAGEGGISANQGQDQQQLCRVAPEGEQEPRSWGEDASALLVESLRAQLAQLQQQLAGAEEKARAVAVAEWEALVVAGREELEEVQQLAAQLEEQLAACQRELAAERATRKALEQQLQVMVAAGAGPRSEVDPRQLLQPQAGHPESGVSIANNAACYKSVEPGQLLPSVLSAVVQGAPGCPVPHPKAPRAAAPECARGPCHKASCTLPPGEPTRLAEPNKGCTARDAATAGLKRLRPAGPAQSREGARAAEQGVPGCHVPMGASAAEGRAAGASATEQRERALLARIPCNGSDSTAGAAGAGVPLLSAERQQNGGGGNGSGAARRSGKGQRADPGRRGKRQRDEGGSLTHCLSSDEQEQDAHGKGIAVAEPSKAELICQDGASGGGGSSSGRRRVKDTGLSKCDRGVEGAGKAGVLTVSCAEVPGATPVAGRTRRKRQALPR